MEEEKAHMEQQLAHLKEKAARSTGLEQQLREEQKKHLALEQQLVELEKKEETSGSSAQTEEEEATTVNLTVEAAAQYHEQGCRSWRSLQMAAEALVALVIDKTILGPARARALASVLIASAEQLSRLPEDGATVLYELFEHAAVDARPQILCALEDTIASVLRDKLNLPETLAEQLVVAMEVTANDPRSVLDLVADPMQILAFVKCWAAESAVGEHALDSLSLAVRSLLLDRMGKVGSQGIAETVKRLIESLEINREHLVMLTEGRLEDLAKSVLAGLAEEYRRHFYQACKTRRSGLLK